MSELEWMFSSGSDQKTVGDAGGPHMEAAAAAEMSSLQLSKRLQGLSPLFQDIWWNRIAPLPSVHSQAK